jgi:hypothetical protein
MSMDHSNAKPLYLPRHPRLPEALPPQNPGVTALGPLSSFAPIEHSSHSSKRLVKVSQSYHPLQEQAWQPSASSFPESGPKKHRKASPDAPDSRCPRLQTPGSHSALRNPVTKSSDGSKRQSKLSSTSWRSRPTLPTSCPSKLPQKGIKRHHLPRPVPPSSGGHSAIRNPHFALALRFPLPPASS